LKSMPNILVVHILLLLKSSGAKFAVRRTCEGASAGTGAASHGCCSIWGNVEFDKGGKSSFANKDPRSYVNSRECPGKTGEMPQCLLRAQNHGESWTIMTKHSSLPLVASQSETARDDNMSHQLKDDNLQLSAHLKEARANAEMLRETCAAKDGTIRSLTTDIQELQDQVGVLTRKHQAFHDAEETIADLRNQLERERRERSSLSRARAQLLNQLSDEEHKLYQVLGTGAAGSIAGINDGNDC
jgi:hypothetical protein